MHTLAQAKQLINQHTRTGVTFSAVVQELEGELKRMQEKKLSQELIDRKDLQIETLIEFFNETETLVQFFKLAILNLHMDLTHCEHLLFSTHQKRDYLIEAILSIKTQRNGQN